MLFFGNLEKISFFASSLSILDFFSKTLRCAWCIAVHYGNLEFEIFTRNFFSFFCSVLLITYTNEIQDVNFYLLIFSYNKIHHSLLMKMCVWSLEFISVFVWARKSLSLWSILLHFSWSLVWKMALGLS